MNSSAFIHKTEKFHSAEAQELPQAPFPYAHITGMCQVKEQSVNLPLPCSHLHLCICWKTYSNSLDSLCLQQANVRIQAAKGISITQLLVTHTTSSTPGNSLLCLCSFDQLCTAFALKNINVTKRTSLSTRAKSICCYFNV